MCYHRNLCVGKYPFFMCAYYIFLKKRLSIKVVNELDL